MIERRKKIRALKMLNEISLDLEHFTSRRWRRRNRRRGDWFR
jgi:hypothetical protein